MTSLPTAIIPPTGNDLHSPYHVPMETPPTAQPAAPLRGAVPLLAVALATILAWLTLSLVFSDLADVARLRLADALWCWVVLTLTQFAVTRPGDAPVYRWLGVPLLAAGSAFCLARQLLVPIVYEGHNLFAYIEAALIALAAAVIVWQALRCLAGREVHVSDLCLFTMIQWTLLWTLATALFSWRTAGNIDMTTRQLLLEFSLFGIAFHAAGFLALRHLPAHLGGKIFRRAILITLALYNFGLIGLVLHWPWTGCTLMFLGAMVMLLAFTGLFAGNRRGLALLALFACIFLAAACGMRPFDNTLYAGWRHAIAAGVVGLTVLLALALSARAGVPANAAVRILVGVGATCFVLGIVARIAIEIAETANFSAHRSAPLASLLETVLLASALEILGLLLVSLAALRSQLVRNVLRRRQPAGVP
jgi:hypothetical protein